MAKPSSSSAPRTPLASITSGAKAGIPTIPAAPIRTLNRTGPFDSRFALDGDSEGAERFRHRSPALAPHVADRSRTHRCFKERRALLCALGRPDPVCPRYANPAVGSQIRPIATLTGLMIARSRLTSSPSSAASDLDRLAVSPISTTIRPASIRRGATATRYSPSRNFASSW
jgi:hypothetical protein